VVGDQLPIIPFGEVLFKMGAVVPEHNDKDVTKLGTIVGFVTVTKDVKLVAH
jgi:hypothetical protein